MALGQLAVHFERFRGKTTGKILDLWLQLHNYLVREISAQQQVHASAHVGASNGWQSVVSIASTWLAQVIPNHRAAGLNSRPELQKRFVRSVDAGEPRSIHQADKAVIMH